MVRWPISWTRSHAPSHPQGSRDLSHPEWSESRTDQHYRVRLYGLKPQKGKQNFQSLVLPAWLFHPSTRTPFPTGLQIHYASSFPPNDDRRIRPQATLSDTSLPATLFKATLFSWLSHRCFRDAVLYCHIILHCSIKLESAHHHNGTTCVVDSSSAPPTSDYFALHRRYLTQDQPSSKTYHL